MRFSRPAADDFALESEQPASGPQASGIGKSFSNDVTQAEAAPSNGQVGKSLDGAANDALLTSHDAATLAADENAVHQGAASAPAAL